MKKTFLITIFLVPIFTFAQRDSLFPGVYSWKEPVKDNSKASTLLFEGSTYDMQWLQMTANVIPPSKSKTKIQVPANEEQLVIIKSGNLTIGRDSTYSIGAGSVALLMPGESFLIQNNDQASCSYYVMKYRSKKPLDVNRGTAAGGSLIMDWNKIEFKPHDKGGRRDFFERPTAICTRFEMHVTTLKGGLKSHDPHTHRAAEMIVVIDGKTEMLIGDKMFKGEKGSIYYLPSNILHGIQNIGTGNCSYFAFQFE
jgi:(S)-ureidoglycine aminohydrolase